MIKHRVLIFTLLTCVVIASNLTLEVFAKEATETLSPPVKLTTAEDHFRVMGLLNMKTIRPGANGDPDSENSANYNESMANPYPYLPDPLRLKNGQKVINEKTWWEQRRPEIVEDFDREIYGRMPSNMPSVSWRIIKTITENVGSKNVVTKTLVGHVDNKAYPYINIDIDMTLSAPAASTEAVPVVLVYGTSAAFKERMRKRFTEEQLAKFRGPGPTAKEQALAKGWAYAELIPTSIQSDNAEGLTLGIIGLLNKGKPRGLDDWGVLRAWAWGFSAAVDYFETNAQIDASRVAIEGHSRYGKAALVAMAFDQRIAAGFISSSGGGGAKIWRRDFGEKVSNIANAGAYHWVAGNFLKYAGPLTADDMPGDQHHLIALCAPRPVFISSGNVGDSWVDAKGMFLAAAGAGPVYELLGKKGLGTQEFPKVEHGLMGGEVAYRQHNSGHTPGPNWPVFLDYINRYFVQKK